MALVLREMRLDDAEFVAVVHHRAWVDTYGADLPPDYFETWTVADSVARWKDILGGPAEPGVSRLVALEESEVVGFAAAGPGRAVDGRPAPVRPRVLWALYVARERLGTGVGQRLLARAVPPAAAAELWVAEGNARAIAFYGRNGFRLDGTSYTDDRIPGLLVVRMVR